MYLLAVKAVWEYERDIYCICFVYKDRRMKYTEKAGLVIRYAFKVSGSIRSG